MYFLKTSGQRVCAIVSHENVGKINNSSLTDVEIIVSKLTGDLKPAGCEMK